MRLLELLSTLDDETLERLAEPKLGAGEMDSRAVTCVNLESAIRSPKHVRDTVLNLQPPAFKLLERLLDADDNRVATGGLREFVQAETAALAERVSSGQLPGGRGREDAIRIYRRVFTEARRSDLTLDPSETAVLGVLRHELKIRQVEHFLIEHHSELQGFWNTDHAYLDATTELRTAGLVFALDSTLLLPKDIVPILRQILGLEMSNGACGRLYSRLSGQDAGEALARAEIRATGTKDEKIARLVENYVQPSEVLDVLSLATLRDMCRDLGIASSGAKDEVAERIHVHFATNADITKEEPAPPPPPEPRLLGTDAFAALFGCLRGQDLSDVLQGIGAHRVTGSKEQLVALAANSPYCETTMLMKLDLNQLETVLSKNHLKTSGAKRERVLRLIEHFASGATTAGADHHL